MKKNQKTQQIQRKTENPKEVSKILELQEKMKISEKIRKFRKLIKNQKK